MTATTWMRYPGMPDDQMVEVPDEVVRGHRAAGWVITDPPPPPAPRTEPEAPAPAEASVSEPEPQTPTRRRSPKEAEQ